MGCAAYMHVTVGPSAGIRSTHPYRKLTFPLPESFQLPTRNGAREPLWPDLSRTATAMSSRAPQTCHAQKAVFRSSPPCPLARAILSSPPVQRSMSLRGRGYCIDVLFVAEHLTVPYSLHLSQL